MNPELNKLSPEDLVSRRMRLINDAAGNAQKVLDSYLDNYAIKNNEHSPNAGLRDDLLFADKQSTASVGHFNRLSNTTFEDNSLPKKVSGTEAPNNVSYLADYRKDVNNAFNEQTPNPISSGDVTLEKVTYQPTAITTVVDDIDGLQKLRNSVNYAFDKQTSPNPVSSQVDNLDVGAIASVTPIQPHASPTNPADFIIPEKEAA